MTVILLWFSGRGIFFSFLCKNLKFGFWRNFIRFRFLIHIITMGSLMFRLLFNHLVLICNLWRCHCWLLQIGSWWKILVFWRSIRNYLRRLIVSCCGNNSFCIRLSFWIKCWFLTVLVKITISLWKILRNSHLIFCLLKYKVYCTNFFLTRNNDLW